LGEIFWGYTVREVDITGRGDREHGGHIAGQLGGRVTNGRAPI